MKQNLLPVQEMERILIRLRMKQEAYHVIATEDKSVPMLNYLTHAKMIEKGNDADVSLRMLQPHKIQRMLNSAEAAWLAESYSLAADTIQLILDANKVRPKSGPKLDEQVNLLGEVQSFLRWVVASFGLPEDEDQYALYMLLKIFSKQSRIFIRYLSKSKTTFNASDINSLKIKIKVARLPLDKQREVETKLSEIQQLVSSVQQNDKQWLLIAQRVKHLLSTGMKPSDVRLRDILLPIYEEIPVVNGCPKEFRLVIDSIDSFLATRIEPEGTIAEEVPTQEVSDLRQFLEGRKVVLIGGSERKHSARELERAFGLEELIWVSTTPNTHVEHFEPYVRTPNVAVVLLAIPFVRHGHGAVSEYCDKANVPFVRLLAGYGINQVARRILSQCGNRLKPSSLMV